MTTENNLNKKSCLNMETESNSNRKSCLNMKTENNSYKKSCPNISHILIVTLAGIHRIIPAINLPDKKYPSVRMFVPITEKLLRCQKFLAKLTLKSVWKGY